MKTTITPPTPSSPSIRVVVIQFTTFGNYPQVTTARLLTNRYSTKVTYSVVPKQHNGHQASLSTTFYISSIFKCDYAGTKVRAEPKIRPSYVGINCDIHCMNLAGSWPFSRSKI